MSDQRVKVGNSDLEVFPLVLGGNTFGWTSDEAASRAVLDEYAEDGGNFVDTADVYSAWAPGNAGGESKIILGRWLAVRGNRDRMVIATKVSEHPQYKGLSRGNILAAADESLLRLGGSAAERRRDRRARQGVGAVHQVTRPRVPAGWAVL